MSSMSATASRPESSVIVPVYGNADHIAALVERLEHLHAAIPGGIEAVIVVDASPDDSLERLSERLPDARFPSRLLTLARNFGSFAAIRAGLEAASGRYFAVMAADLQEPASLIETMLETLREDRADVVVGTRNSRRDPWTSRLSSRIFWGLNRRLIEPAIPSGGVDVFGCNRAFRERLLAFTEAHSSLIGQIFWLGFRRVEVPYDRAERLSGRSGWSWRARLKYLSDSLFAFSDIPIRLFTLIGLFGLIVSIVLAIAVVGARLSGAIEVPGYAATVVTIVFFSGLNLFGLGVIGSYVWRTFENTKQRPLAVVMHSRDYSGGTGP